MPRELIGETLLNQFRVENYIASGGMATIYRVWDLQRSVPLAMKVLNPELAEDPAFMARFQREARSLQMLIHPHIVPFYGLYRAGELTFILERYIDGPSLDEVLRRRAGRPLPLPEALVYFKALYTSLGYGHAQGIIHCDIKPGNVLIDQGGHVYLTDFGIARYADATVTTTGAAIGTPLYMAPEQIRGERVSARTDVYGLGVLMFELLTGQRPFRGDGDIPPGVGEQISDRIRYQQMYTPPPDPRSINPYLPAGLAEVVLTAMAKDPEARYPGVQAMAEAISQAIAARFDSLPDRVTLVPPVGPGSTGPWSEDLFPPSLENPPADGAVLLPEDRQDWAPGPAGEGVPATIPSPPVVGRPVPEHPPAARRPRRIAQLAGLIGLLVLLGLCGLAAARLAGRLNPGAVKTGVPTQAQAGGIPTQPAAPSAQPGEPTQTPGGPSATPAPSTPTAQPPTPVQGDFAVTGAIAVPVAQGGAQSLSLLDGANGQFNPVPGVPNVTQRSVSAPSWSPDGTHITYAADYNSRTHIIVMDVAENEPYQLPAAERYARVSSPAFLPDGKRVSFWALSEGKNWLIIADAVTGEQVDQVALPNYRNLLVWNWQTNQVAFVQQNGGPYQVWVSQSADAPGQTFNLNGESYAPAWSNDGQWIAFQSNEGSPVPAESEIWIARADGSELHQITDTPTGFWSRAPSWSPDGKQIAFVSNQAGSRGADLGELFVVELATGQIRQMTRTGGAVYDWRPAWKP